MHENEVLREFIPKDLCKKRKVSYAVGCSEFCEWMVMSFSAKDIYVSRGQKLCNYSISILLFTSISPQIAQLEILRCIVHIFDITCGICVVKI